VYALVAAFGPLFLTGEPTSTRLALAVLALAAGGVGTVVHGAGGNRLELALWADTVVALGLWWLLGPIAGVDIVLFTVIAAGALLLPRARAIRLIAAAVTSELLQAPLHLFAQRLTLPLMHTPAQVGVDAALLVGIGIRILFLLTSTVLFFTIAHMLGRALGDLEAQLHSKDRFIAAVAHAVRTPLTAVLGFSEALRAETAAPEEQEEMLTILSEQSAALAAIVENLLVAARADVGELTVDVQPVTLGPLVRRVLTDCSLCRAGRSEHVEDPVAPVVVAADPERLRQLLRNLVDNARAHGGEHLVVRIARAEPWGRIEVRDDGPGVPADLVPEMFDRYRGGAGPSTAGTVGLGLGVARRLVRMMGGDVTYTRERAETVFSVALPLAELPVANRQVGVDRPRTRTGTVGVPAE